MDIKINNSYISRFDGPSQNYYLAQERFQEILKNKLGVVSYQENNVEEKSEIFDDNSDADLNKEAENLIEASKKYTSSPIFDTENNYKTGLKRDSFSSSKPLNNSIGSVFMNGIIDTNDIRKKSNFSAKDIDQRLKGSPLYGLGEDFKKAEDLYGVNSIIMLAIAKLESDYGRSKIARDKNNLFGFGAYDNSPYESAKSYGSKQESIYDLAKLLSEKYLKEGAECFKGYSIDDVGKSYCTSSSWAEQIKNISRRITTRQA